MYRMSLSSIVFLPDHYNTLLAVTHASDPSPLALPRVRVHRRHRRDGDDILDIVAGLQDVRGRAHAQQDGTDGFSLRQARERL